MSRHLQTLATLAAPLALPLQRLTGRWHGSSETGRLLFAGSRASAEFVAGALMQIDDREPRGALDSPLALRGRAFRAACGEADLVAAAVPPLWRPCLPAGTLVRLPAWVSQEIRAPAGADIALPPALRKEIQRHTRRERYAVAYSTEPRDVLRFYEGFYRPYVAARYGAGAVLVDEPRFFAVARGMTLAMLQADGEWVAGILFRLRGSTLGLGWFGSASAELRSGASEVLDAAVIDHAVSRGARRVVLGHSRPSLADGVVRYKSRFGAVLRPTRFPQQVIGLEPRRVSPAMAAAIQRARFVVFDGDAPRAWDISSGRLPSAGSPETAPSS
jgi:hypothetical protein